MHIVLIQSKKCPICRQNFSEHSKVQEQICNMIMVKEFSGNCPGFDVEYLGRERQDL